MCQVRVLSEMRVLFEVGPYMRKYGMHNLMNLCLATPELSKISVTFNVWNISEFIEKEFSI